MLISYFMDYLFKFLAKYFCCAFFYNFNGSNLFINVNNLNLSFDSSNFNSPSSQLSPNAKVFCPSVNFNSVECFNKLNGKFNLNIVYSNLQGMLDANHLDEFKSEICKSTKIHLLICVETWLRNEIHNNSIINVPGYNIFRSDRISCDADRNRGGGVAIYVKNNLRVKVLERSFGNNHSIIGAEFLFIEILTRNGKFLVCAVYRTNKCSSADTNKLFQLITNASALYSNIIIIGDLNIDILKFPNGLRNLRDNFHLINHACPTHFWPNASPSLIDVALTKNHENINFFGH